MYVTIRNDNVIALFYAFVETTVTEALATSTHLLFIVSSLFHFAKKTSHNKKMLLNNLTNGITVINWIFFQFPNQKSNTRTAVARIYTDKYL